MLHQFVVGRGGHHCVTIMQKLPNTAADVIDDKCRNDGRLPGKPRFHSINLTPEGSHELTKLSSADAGSSGI